MNDNAMKTIVELRKQINILDGMWRHAEKECEQLQNQCDQLRAEIERLRAARVMNGYHYLASPYDHSDERVMTIRYEEALQATAWFLRQKIWVYSPIVHCHEIAVKFNLPRNYEFWKEYNQAMLRRADGLYVLCISGWDQSRGVTDEVLFANGLNLETKFITSLVEAKNDLHFGD